MLVDLQRYSGKWYELGRYSQPYEQGCTSAIAYYRVVDEKLEIVNECWVKSSQGRWKRSRTIHGWARPTRHSNVLSVRFDTIPFDSEYSILWTDYDTLALVGNPEKNYYWILSRTPQISDTLWMWIQKSTRKLGFDLDRVIINNNRGL